MKKLTPGRYHVQQTSQTKKTASMIIFILFGNVLPMGQFIQLDLQQQLDQLRHPFQHRWLMQFHLFFRLKLIDIRTIPITDFGLNGNDAVF